MFAYKPPVPEPDDVNNYRKQLEYLYARRTTIDALIKSLQTYDRYRAKRTTDQNRKSA
jgi:hypothetical protein